MTFDEWCALTEEEREELLEEHREFERGLRKEPITQADLTEFVRQRGVPDFITAQNQRSNDDGDAL